jgi:DNA-binding transcriptional MerR regulator
MIGNELLSIKDFAKLTGIKQSTLRYYDDLGLFSPAKRGSNSYRYYSPQQIITINSIHLLHELDMSIRAITALERDRTPEALLDVLTEKEEELKEELAKLEVSYNVIRTLRQLIHLGLSVEDNSVQTQYMEEQSLITGPVNDFGGSAYFYDAFLKFCAAAGQYRIDLRFPVGGKFESFESFRGNPSEPTHFYSADPSGHDKKPAGKHVVGYSRGYYGKTDKIEERVAAYLEEKGLTPIGDVYMLYILDELSIRDQNEYLMQCSVRVE